VHGNPRRQCTAMVCCLRVRASVPREWVHDRCSLWRATPAEGDSIVFQHDSAGVIPRAARYLFDRIREMTEDGDGDCDNATKVVITASFCEVYNEKVYDLLDLANDKLTVRWDHKAKTFVVTDLLHVECKDFDDMMTVVIEGQCPLEPVAGLAHVRALHVWRLVVLLQGTRTGGSGQRPSTRTRRGRTGRGAQSCRRWAVLPCSAPRALPAVSTTATSHSRAYVCLRASAAC
jgi:hypothetical protein